MTEIKWLTRPEAAARLRVHPSTVDRMADRGELPRYKIGPGPGASVRFDVSDVDALLIRT